MEPQNEECIISGLRSINSTSGVVANRRSPVPLVHGDDDRNVPFQQITDLRSKTPRPNVGSEKLMTAVQIRIRAEVQMLAT